MKPYQLAVYERVSTEAQDFASQHTALIRWLDDNGYRRSSVLWYEDKATGANLTRRGIERLSRDIASGRVTLVVFYSIDRFARELISGLNHLEAWAQAGCRMTFVADGIDVPAGPLADAMLKMILSIKLCMAESERARIRERVRLGQLSAMRRGVRFGAPVRLPLQRIRSLRAQGEPVREIAKKCRVSVASVYRVTSPKKAEIK